MCETGHLAVEKGDRTDKNLRLNFLVLLLLLSLAMLNTGCGAALQGAGTPAGPTNGQAQTGQLRLSPPSAQATVGVAYNGVTSVSGGVAPYLFSISAGSLPPGLVLNPITGSITGTPSVAGTYNFTLSVSTLPAKQYESLPGNGASSQPGAKYGSTPVHLVVSASGSGTVISISPASATVISQAQQQFTASVSGTPNTAVTWSATAGTISANGMFTAPKVTSSTPATITATSTANPNWRGAAIATVTPVAALAVSNSSLPQGNTSTPYTGTLSATGGETPYQWSISSGALPSGILLQPSTGVITGMTALAGSYPFTAKVTDSTAHSATAALTLTVSSGSASGFDGPAELPRIYIQTAMANTPAPGATTTVNAGGDLQSALNNANCGDTIQLQAGATFTGVFTFPAKSCDDNHWIIVRTSAGDSALPPEGSRLTPCYAGVSSLPGRPALQCSSTTNVTAKLLMAGGGNGPILFATGANHYRLIGLEITRLAGTGIVYALFSAAATGTANNLILDRVWVHGTAQDDTNKGVDFGGMGYGSVIDSYFSDMHCTSISGSCTDAHAIGGGSSATGPFKIVDNFLEASGENVMFGGDQDTMTAADIQISQNHFFKPLTWLKGQPGYVGGTSGNPFIVKNLCELKNAQRVLLEANIMEYSWGGFSQNGYAIVITPKNQAGPNDTNLCPICQVTDVTVRYSTISHVGAGLQIANALSDNGGPALNGERYSIHDVTIDDMNSVLYSGSGNLAEIMSQYPGPLLQNVSINHVTAFPSQELFSVGAFGNIPIANFTFTNSIVSTGIYPVWSTGGGTPNCAYYDKPLTTFNACFSPYSFASNALIGSPASYPPTLWPSVNFFPATASAVQFVNYNNGNGGNYQLLSTSPYHNAGTDGKDLGADVATIVSETTGVY